MLVASVLAAMRQAVAAAQSDPATHFPSHLSASVCSNESAPSAPTQTLPALSKCSLQPQMLQHSSIPDTAIHGRDQGGPPDEAATPSYHADIIKPDASQGVQMRPGSWQGKSPDGLGMQPDGSFPGSFLGLEAPATVARVREAIGGPSIAAMLRNAAGLNPADPSSADDWELV